ECFLKFYRKLVERSIKKYSIFRKNDKILLAVSGGKDSAAMACVLRDIGYDFSMLHIDLGIGNYSKDSRKKVEELAEILDRELYVISLHEYGFEISDVKSKTCSACGIAKRYIMNRFAREKGFSVVATGHTAEDIVSFYLKNIAGGQKEYAEKLLPRIEPFSEMVVAKAKPIFEMSEKENMLYAVLKKLPIKFEDCPYAPKPDWKEIVYEIERRKPGFVKNFLRGLLVKSREMPEAKKCSICGEISTGEICAFCKLRIKLGALKP
ncbi:MAG: ATP-binding protein, partial [Archaeoglobaceae archaeon]